MAAIVTSDVIGYKGRCWPSEDSKIMAKLTGDGALIEFASAVEALAGAIEFQ